MIKTDSYQPTMARNREGNGTLWPKRFNAKYYFYSLVNVVDFLKLHYVWSKRTVLRIGREFGYRTFLIALKEQITMWENSGSLIITILLTQKNVSTS